MILLYLAKKVVRLEELLTRLQQVGLKIKPSKYHILCKRVKYLGYIVSEKGVEVDPGKISCGFSGANHLNHETLRNFLVFASIYPILCRDSCTPTHPNRNQESGRGLSSVKSLSFLSRYI